MSTESMERLDRADVSDVLYISGVIEVMERDPYLRGHSRLVSAGSHVCERMRPDDLRRWRVSLAAVVAGDGDEPSRDVLCDACLWRSYWVGVCAQLAVIEDRLRAAGPGGGGRSGLPPAPPPAPRPCAGLVYGAYPNIRAAHE